MKSSYLEDVMRRIMGYNSQKLYELLPDHWLNSRHQPAISLFLPRWADFPVT
jgi:hypothetical protein